MNREDQILAWIREGLARYGKELAGHRVILFGSRGRRDHRPRSDFDIGVIGERPLSAREFHRIGDFLEGLPTLYRIDWVDLNRAPEALRAHALRHGEVLYE